MGVNTRANYLVVHNRRVIVDAFPMGIDYEKFVEITSLPSTKSNIRKIRASAAADKIVLSIDRLDYSKGILERLLAFELFLKTHRNYRQKVSLLMVVVPSRDAVPHYRAHKEEIDRLVSDITARNQTLGDRKSTRMKSSQ